MFLSPSAMPLGKRAITFSISSGDAGKCSYCFWCEQLLMCMIHTHSFNVECLDEPPVQPPHSAASKGVLIRANPGYPSPNSWQGIPSGVPSLVGASSFWRLATLWRLVTAKFSAKCTCKKPTFTCNSLQAPQVAKD